MSSEQVEALEKIDSYRGIVDTFETVDEFNDALKNIGKEKSRALKIQYFAILKEECLKHNLNYDGKNQVFI